MTYDIALPYVSSCHAGHIRAKYLRSIHLLCVCFFHLHSLQIDAPFFHSPMTFVHQLMEDAIPIVV